MNTVRANITSSRYAETNSIFQYDTGRKLKIYGCNLPKSVEVQFSTDKEKGNTITRVGNTNNGVTTTIIPNQLLNDSEKTSNFCIFAFLYNVDNDGGRTEYVIKIPVVARPKPENPSEEPLPEPNIFHETIEAVNASAERAEKAERNAKASATEAGKYASSASESAAVVEKTKEDALKEVGEKKREAIEAIREQEETSVRKIINHTDNEIQRIQNQIANSKGELEQTIENASASNEELEQSIETASDTKTALDESTELAKTAKTELDTSTQKAGTAKNALDESIEIAGTVNETLSATVKQAGALDTSLGEKIETGTQLKTDIVASGEKAVKDIQTAGSEQLSKMQAVAEEFTADREQITINKEDIGSLKEDLSDKITKFYASNQGETHLADSDNGKIMDMMLYGKSSQDGTPTPDNPVEIKSVVNPTVKVTNEDETESQTVTLPYTLNAIPVSSGGNVTINGQQYMADYIDVEKGKLVKKVKRIDLKNVSGLTNLSYGTHANGVGYLAYLISDSSNEKAIKDIPPLSNNYIGSKWTSKSGYVYVPSDRSVIIVDSRFTDRSTAVGLIQDTYIIYALATPIEENLTAEQVQSLKALKTYYPTTNINIDSEQLEGYTVFNYPISMANGWDYVKKQLNDNRDYIYDMDTQSAEAYVNSEYAVALTELEV